MQVIPTLGKQFKSNIFTRGLSLICSLIQAIVIAQCLGAESAGQLYYLFSNIQFAALLFGLNTDAGVYYYTATSKISTDKLLTVSIMVGMCIGVLVFVTVNLFSSAIVSSVPVWIIALAAAGNFLLNCFTRISNGKGFFEMPNYISSSATIVFVIILLLPINTESKLTVYFLLIFLQSVVLLFYLQREKGIAFRVRFLVREEFKMIARYSLKALFANLLFFLVLRFDYWIVKMYCSSADLGIYLQASKLGQMLILLPQTLAAVIFANSYRKSEQTKEVIARTARLLFQFYSIIALIFLLIGKPIWKMVLGESFISINSIFLLLVPGFFALSVLAMLSAWFSGKGNLRINAAGALLACSAIVIGDLLFIPKYGIKAAALISSVGYTVNLLYSFRSYRHVRFGELKFFRISDYFLFRKIITLKK